MLSFSRRDVVDVIFASLEWDKARHGHTVESLIALLTRMGIVCPYAPLNWTPLQVRLIIAALLDHGQLDMRTDGTLFIPVATPDPAIECFLGSWYVTMQNGLVKGPYNSATEAHNVYAQLCTNGNLQAMASEAQ